MDATVIMGNVSPQLTSETIDILSWMNELQYFGNQCEKNMFKKID